ncbi:uncharacterized protein GGS22DRAFT_114782 [Annulohypoxylon maeteangense]|uniref:uncharacterized protein n=1 Tax=Annulohypoxylon maeteangense TaxID=1927788 RepID=UPI00200729B7|nr:uncharacterized protein GGS22DRAFT_114782 [Annulohypoxylon maeteangense]KAI0886535.1 hypothetical protein GGS22DRAFT_114782 [Annulohypoxylon maeteangense]
MQFLVSFCLSFAFLAVSVRGDLHPDCVCNNGGTYVWRMTTNACTVYNNAAYQWGGSNYNTASGRCDANSGAQLGGNEWEAACKSVAKTGFQCVDGVGTCFADPDEVRGSCSK